METEPSTSTKLSPSPVPAKRTTDQIQPTSSASPWEDFVTGKKTSAGRFLAKMDAARLKGGITVPDDSTRSRFAEAVAAKPDRVNRLVALLQACVSCSDIVRNIVAGFAEASIKHLGIVSFPEPLDADGFSEAVSSWLGGIRKKPMKSAELNHLFLFLHFGWHRQLLTHDTAFAWVASAVSQPVKSRPKKMPLGHTLPTPMEVLLASSPAAPLLSALVAFSKASRTVAEKLIAQIESYAAEIARLTAECASLNAAILSLHADIATLNEQKAAAESRVVELEKEIVDIRDGYQHKLDELRGRIRGMLQGQLTRWLQTALDASRSEPPWTQAIQERLEDALKLIERETQWLQPLA